MVRNKKGRGFYIHRFPHARGDGPTAKMLFNLWHLFSPRPWGWSDVVMLKRSQVTVFPTPVGMVRKCTRICWSERCFPHARGDGPLSHFPLHLVPLFSPRPWGWSAGKHDTERLVVVFPTPVGMVRLIFPEPSCMKGFPHARGDGPRGNQL